METGCRCEGRRAVGRGWGTWGAAEGQPRREWRRGQVSSRPGSGRWLHSPRTQSVLPRHALGCHPSARYDVLSGPAATMRGGGRARAYCKAGYGGAHTAHHARALLLANVPACHTRLEQARAHHAQGSEDVLFGEDCRGGVLSAECREC